MRETKEADRVSREMGIPSRAGMKMYGGLRYCGDCLGGPMMYGNGTCPCCGGTNGVPFAETRKIPNHAEICRRAYRLYEERNRKAGRVVHGHDQQDYADADRMLRDDAL